MDSVRRLKGVCRLGAVATICLMLGLSEPAQAFQFTLGEIDASLDSTLSYGLSWRAADRDKELIGRANGGRAYSVNGDDGNLNYDRNSLISNAFKLTSDLQLQYENVGMFLRGTAFYDIESMDRDRERTDLSDDALDLVGKDADLLDAYVWWNFDLGSLPGQVRLGRQVLSWGESTFIQGGINAINPVE